ncbi:MAG: DNA-binding response regulator [Acidobacteriaceae bacterium]|jgi:CheY-like chemotaxis protein|nr:DNA-binding response regulator [Acidobacteriaceae bacterium]
MNEAVKFQMWAVQLAFSPNVNESFGALKALLLNRGYRVTGMARGRASLRPEIQERRSMGFKILIVDDHEVVRQGIRTILRARPQWEVTGEAVNGKDAIEKARSLDPDVIIMDITMPEMSGIEATREISKLKLRAAVLVFTMHESKNLATTVQEAGARGFVLKSHAARDLLDALEALLGGGTFFGEDAGKAAKSKAESGKPGLNFRLSLRLGLAS